MYIFRNKLFYLHNFLTILILEIMAIYYISCLVYLDIETIILFIFFYISIMYLNLFLLKCIKFEL